MIRSIAGPLHRLLSIIPGMASEVPLGDLSVRGSAERHTHVLQFINGPWRVFDQDFDSILVTKIVTSLYGIEEIPFPVIFFFIAERSGDSSLGCTRMGTGRKDFADHGHIGLACTLNGGSKAGQASSHNDDIVLVDHPNPINSSGK
jgi:hypothetical protein